MVVIYNVFLGKQFKTLCKKDWVQVYRTPPKRTTTQKHFPRLKTTVKYKKKKSYISWRKKKHRNIRKTWNVRELTIMNMNKKIVNEVIFYLKSYQRKCECNRLFVFRHTTIVIDISLKWKKSETSEWNGIPVTTYSKIKNTVVLLRKNLAFVDERYNFHLETALRDNYSTF